MFHQSLLESLQHQLPASLCSMWWQTRTIIIRWSSLLVWTCHPTLTRITARSPNFTAMMRASARHSLVIGLVRCMLAHGSHTTPAGEA